MIKFTYAYGPCSLFFKQNNFLLHVYFSFQYELWTKNYVMHKMTLMRFPHFSIYYQNIFLMLNVSLFNCNWNLCDTKILTYHVRLISINYLLNYESIKIKSTNLNIMTIHKSCPKRLKKNLKRKCQAFGNSICEWHLM